VSLRLGASLIANSVARSRGSESIAIKLAESLFRIFLKILVSSNTLGFFIMP
jgi:hypothetical protein